jgi:hypothetical protein
MWWWEKLSTSDVVIASCTLLGPIFAVQAQKFVEEWRAKKDRHLAIFRTLMTTRATRLSPQHIEAINTIPIDYYKQKDIIDLWEEYFSHLCKVATTGPEHAVWNAEDRRHFIGLLLAIGKKLGYEFNAAEMEKIYFPNAHMQIQNDQLVTQHCLARWLAGDLSVKVDVSDMPGPDDEALRKQEELRVAFLSWLKKGNAAPS